MQSKSYLRQVSLIQTNMRYFGVTPKLPKLHLTVRTPYKTFFEDYSAFNRIYVFTQKGNMAIGQKSIPRVYLLPPGQMSVKNMMAGEGKKTDSESGEFMHTGGWLFVHDNNSIEVNLLECCKKEELNFDKMKAETSETDSPAGKVAAELQAKTYKLFQKRR